MKIKPLSFRVTEEARDRLNQVVKSEGWQNQDIALNKLIDLYEIEQAKITISERKTEIEDFENHLQALSEIYRISLQLNQDAEERVKNACRQTLDSQQKIIENLQKEKEQLQAEKEHLGEYQEKNQDLKKENERLLSEIKKTEALHIHAEERLKEHTKLRDNYREMKDFYENEKKEKQKLEDEQRTSEAEQKLELLELRTSHQEEIENLKNLQHEAESKATEEYKALFRELEELRKENYALKEKSLKAEEDIKPEKKTTKKATTTRKKITKAKAEGAELAEKKEDAASKE